ncbi:cupin domain-containing protein [Haloarcula litorea]|uniref:cupin domain-containing protein n=1 Tax=Haloarcula litorea TaxID=3032579 RepID=UPI0023E79249|nr:cupin domain-containing protein [Halomicroarcula sp. GDY20]
MDTDEQPQAWMLDSQEGDAYWSLGSLTVLKATAENTNGSFSMIEEHVPAGQSPPMHVHQSDDEMWYIIDGTVTFEVDGERFTATNGSTVFAPHGRPHSYLTEEETRWLMFVHEPGLEQLWASVGSPADTWTIPDDSEVEAQMNRVIEQLEQYGIEIVGDPLVADASSSQ